jgi:hypothetical protein
MDSEMTPALHSIQRYMIAGMVIVAFVTFGIGGWAATSELTGAVIGQGVLVVDSSVKKVKHSTGGLSEVAQWPRLDRPEPRLQAARHDDAVCGA